MEWYFIKKNYKKHKIIKEIIIISATQWQNSEEKDVENTIYMKYIIVDQFFAQFLTEHEVVNLNV